MAVVRQILNWFGVALLLFGAAVLSLAQSARASATSMLVPAVPLAFYICACRLGIASAMRTFALAANWVGAVLAGSLAAAALVGLDGTSALFPLLACAAALYVWNTIGLAVTSLR